jgi:RHS repeat-associated protein
VLRDTTVLTDHAWNPDGTLASRDDGGTGSHAFSYDWAGRLTGVTSPFFSGQVSSAWRNDGLLASRQWPAGAGGAATFSYDAALRPIEMDKVGDAAASFAQTYDRDGNVTSESRSLTGVDGDAGDGTQTFTYDGADRVVSAAGLDAAQGYVYDHDSNRVAAATGTGSVSYAYDRTGQLLSLDDEGHDPELFAYDAWGNLTSSATDFDTLTAYEYDAADRLLSIDPPDATETTFAFDALGRHASSTTNSVTTSFAYLGSSEVAWQLDDGTSLVRSAVDADGGRLAIEADGVDGFSLADLHGNLAAAVNAADDTILSALRYDPYGLVVDDHDSGGGFPRDWAFQGRLDISPDAANPLYEFSARFYAPVLGTFTQLDSYAGEVGDPRSLNRYLYAGANPWTLIDPSGHRYDDGTGGDGGSGCRGCPPVSVTPPPPPPPPSGTTLPPPGAPRCPDAVCVPSTTPSLETPAVPTWFPVELTRFTAAFLPRVTMNQIQGAIAEQAVLAELRATWGPGYSFRLNVAIRDPAGNTISLGGKTYLKPDIAVISDATGEVVWRYEVKSGSEANTHGPRTARQLDLYRQGAAIENRARPAPVELLERPSNPLRLPPRVSTVSGTVGGSVLFLGPVVLHALAGGDPYQETLIDGYRLFHPDRTLEDARCDVLGYCVG